MITLLPYQQEAVTYALARRGTILADEMGLGKTVQAIGLLNADSSIERVLIICPVSLKLNWWRELDRWLARPGVNISVIGYTETERVGATPFDLLIVDEAQYIKNQKSLRAQEVARIAANALKVILLSGTPFENKVEELWSLLCIAAPDYWNPQTVTARQPLRDLPSAVVLKSSKAPQKKQRTANEINFMRFRMRYCGPVKKTFWKSGRVHVAYEFKGGSNLPELREKLRESCMIRRLKKDVLTQLPPKRREIVVFPSNESEAQHSPLFVSSVAPEITVDNYDDVVSKLRANKVAFAEWSKWRHIQGLEKLPMAVDYVADMLENADKVIVFAHHQDVILEFAQAFPGCVTLTGQSRPEERQQAVDRFQNDPRVSLFVGSIRAAGVGLTLTAASVVVFLEIDPNPAVMNQAEDRAHRIGQRNSVLVRYLVSDGSIDARLCQILAKKQDLHAAALGEGVAT